MQRRIIILGAAGRDFHNFNVCFRDDPDADVVAFTATQIPDIAGRSYPAELAGPRYPKGIPIVPEEQLEEFIRRHWADLVVFSYSDVSHNHVMDLASRAVALGADFLLLGADRTMLAARVPVISVCAVRTGSGKSPVARRVVQALMAMGHHPVVMRHPMPYGDLARQRVQRFAASADLDRHRCTIEEREEYEPHLAEGIVVFAGVDYAAILTEAEKEADAIVWDGGNNDTPFLRPDLEIVVADPHRAGHELLYYPGEVNFLRAQVIVINKVDTAPAGSVAAIRGHIQERNPRATVIEADSLIRLDHPEMIRGARVLVIEDGPTLTHGGMAYGAGVIAAREHQAALLVDPRPFAVGSLRQVYQQFRHLGPVLPAMGYSPAQLADLEQTIARVPADVVLVATPIDLARTVRISRPCVRLRYDVVERGRPTLEEIVRQRVEFPLPVQA
ncbi:MAG TPA: cyclic 2,3-diphosphoglycerate synthase [Candidatus Acidoferrales bacterium]|nr:cyclic 2,3-diphosphoglycerate synthase [Candidatus Acidoferrales bacterium]